MPELIAIVDLGAQYAQLIARRVREHHVYSEIFSYRVTAKELERRGVRGVILSGGPASVYEANAPAIDPGILDLGVPVLGICYGMQLVCGLLGGRVESTKGGREFGRKALSIADRSDLFHGFPAESTVWMSHGDSVTLSGGSFKTLASTPSCPIAAVKHAERPIYGVQFHPEVTHTERGSEIYGNFLSRVCGCRGDWRMGSFVEREVEGIRKRVGPSQRVICALSGGVDSAVVAMIVAKAVGDRLTCVFVDNGLLRRGERERVEKTFRERFHLDLRVVDRSDRFLAALAGVTDPERKRKIIGAEFIEAFTQEAQSIPGAEFLAQGTLYPDVIESSSPIGGPSATIKSHHNVGGLPEKLGFELIEPLRLLFKDEVREIGRDLGLPDEIVHRQPFPGPGLAVRVVDAVTKDALEVLRSADALVEEEIRGAGFERKLWQSFAVLLPVKSVGVMGDARTYENVIALRLVESQDGMTADWAYLPEPFLKSLSNRIINEVRGVNRVVLDISSKPPATIEWE
jgi:GMP synthase (glutamine-hydrolysing)